MCTHVLTQHVHVLTYRAHTSSHGLHTFTHSRRPHTYSALPLWKQFLARASCRSPLGQCQCVQTQWTLETCTVRFRWPALGPPSPEPGAWPPGEELQQASLDDLQGRAEARSLMDFSLPKPPPPLIAPKSYSMNGSFFPGAQINTHLRNLCEVHLSGKKLLNVKSLE